VLSHPQYLIESQRVTVAQRSDVGKIDSGLKLIQNLTHLALTPSDLREFPPCDGAHHVTEYEVTLMIRRCPHETVGNRFSNQWDIRPVVESTSCQPRDLMEVGLPEDFPGIGCGVLNVAGHVGGVQDPSTWVKIIDDRLK
jgi:hypothetical protein